MDISLQSAINLLTDKLIIWYQTVIKNIPNIIIAILILAIFVLLAKLIRKIVSGLVSRITKSKAVRNLLTTMSYFSILLVGLFISLEIMNLEKTVTSILAGAGVIGLALGFAFQEIASNFVSGILIAFREPYQIGDIIEIDSYFGEVTEINLRTTSVTTFQGLEVLIPNKDMFTKAFINLTTTPKRRLDLTIGVSYSDDLKKVEEVTLEVLSKIEERVDDMDAEVFYEEFGASSINLSARIWIHYPGNNAFLKARHKAIMNIKKAFDENGITIPFPIRTLDFKNSGELGKLLGDKSEEA